MKNTCVYHLCVSCKKGLMFRSRQDYIRFINNMALLAYKYHIRILAFTVMSNHYHIGIMNIMYVSVTERTREIGLRMSIGAKGRDILAQFLIESILISVTGGLIGVVLGIGAAFLVNILASYPIYIQPWSVILSFAVCTVTGVFFGWYPARKAAGLDPIEAIRYE